jgi:hypothetical protein
LVEIQLPATTNFPTNKGPLLETSKFSLYFSGSCIVSIRSFLIISTTHTGTDRSRMIIQHFPQEWVTKTRCSGSHKMCCSVRI